MRHHRGADDADRQVLHADISKSGRQQGSPHFSKAGSRLRKDKNLNKVADGDRGDQHHDHGLDHPHSEPLHTKQHEHVESRDHDGPRQGNVKQQIESDRTAQNLGQIAGRDRQFAEQPVGQSRPGRIMVAASLGKVLSHHDAEPRRANLQDDRHRARQRHDPEQIISIPGPRLEIGAPIAGIHVADTYQKRRPDERPILSPKTCGPYSAARATEPVQFTERPRVASCCASTSDDLRQTAASCPSAVESDATLAFVCDRSLCLFECRQIFDDVGQVLGRHQLLQIGRH